MQNKLNLSTNYLWRVFLEKVVGGTAGSDLKCYESKSLVKQNARTSAEPALNFSYLLKRVTVKLR